MVSVKRNAWKTYGKKTIKNAFGWQRRETAWIIRHFILIP